ncbi:MAG: hypothetical protein P8013_04945 [Candidatus Sulfobium sp.]|jgi:hypothetical protein
MEDETEGIVCHGLTHITLVEKGILSSTSASDNFDGFPYDALPSSVYSKAIEKPPRLS